MSHVDTRFCRVKKYVFSIPSRINIDAYLMSIVDVDRVVGFDMKKKRNFEYSLHYTPASGGINATDSPYFGPVSFSVFSSAFFERRSSKYPETFPELLPRKFPVILTPKLLP